jgi:hypothetical protein
VDRLGALRNPILLNSFREAQQDACDVWGARLDKALVYGGRKMLRNLEAQAEGETPSLSLPLQHSTADA